MEKKRSIIKHSAAVQIENKMTLLQRRGWNVLLAYAYDNLLGHETHTISLQEFKEYMNMGDCQNNTHIKKFLEGLTGCTVTWNILNKDKEEEWGVAAMLAEALVKHGVIRYSYGPQFAQRLYNPVMYARISLSIQNKFNSKHALALYELCVDYHNEKRMSGQTPFMSIEKFRQMMGIPKKQYSTYKNLSQWVIRPAIEEINEKSDLNVELETEVTGRKIISLRLHITPKPKSLIDNPNKPKLIDLKKTDTIKKRLKEINFTGHVKFRRFHSDEKIQKAFDVFDNLTAQGEEIKNPAGFVRNYVESKNKKQKQILTKQPQHKQLDLNFSDAKKERKEQDKLIESLDNNEISALREFAISKIPEVQLKTEAAIHMWMRRVVKKFISKKGHLSYNPRSS